MEEEIPTLEEETPIVEEETPTTEEEIPTSFKEMYDFFLAGITDDMFMEMTKEDTEEMLEEILMAALPWFEFPVEKNLFNSIDMQNKHFGVVLNLEEKMIIRQYMIVEWIGFQLASIDLIRQKYSGSDFKFTSQASHMKQLKELKQQYQDKGFHLQRLYRRRSRLDEKGNFQSAYVDIIKPL